MYCGWGPCAAMRWVFRQSEIRAVRLSPGRTSAVRPGFKIGPALFLRMVIPLYRTRTGEFTNSSQRLVRERRYLASKIRK
jgi:hypothetical protein